ncbi:hypothetical protein CHARACLAT_016374 [Characodon lateralis]|uniref:NADPH oxidase organizer 1 n=1 Tax=Characodon lateralis TaxID=208331 RepID=A0ABU7DH77_9TELE|nr:hypothetical protein [Characodon lateralis]
MERECFPISIRLTGVLCKEKIKMYITSVLWSDQNEIVVYRGFDDFREMHKQLKKMFSSGSKINKSVRILPKFQSNKVKQKSHGKGLYKSVVCLKYLQKYCNELLRCDQQVLQSADLRRFLQPKEKELQPDFTKNSIMIMPSEDELRSFVGHDTGISVTQPFITETYRCVAPFETKDTKNKPFKAAVDEKLDVLIKDITGWWLVENEEKRMAWFPAPYLDKLEDEEDEEELDGISERGVLYQVVKSYSSTKDDEVSVNSGTVVEVLRKSENGWWLIRHNRKTGYIPTLFLQPYRYPHIQMTPQHNVQNSSSLLAPSSPLHHSCSYGNLSQLPNCRPTSPNLTGPHRSQSLNGLSDGPYAQPAASRSVPAQKHSTTPTSAMQGPVPVIMVQSDGEKTGWILRGESVDSFESDSDNPLSMSASSSLNPSYSANNEQLQLCRTSPPMVASCLSPTNNPKGTLLPSVSDPNLYKGPRSPKVPPRPQPREILTRCTTVTCKNATKSDLSHKLW